MQGRHHDPHSLLGRHGTFVRALRPGATEMYLLVTGPAPERPVLERGTDAPGPPGRPVGGTARPGGGGYRLEAVYGAPGSPGFTFDDPYRHWPTLGDLDLHLFNEGRHRRLWEVLGAHPRAHEGVAGTAFAVWAPNARAVRVVGDWNFWDGRVHPMRSLGSSGVWEIFLPGVEAGRPVQVRDRHRRRTADAESRSVRLRHRGPARHGFGRGRAPPATPGPTPSGWRAKSREADPLDRPMSVYEVHLGSWRWTDDGAGGRRPLTYLELAEHLPAYLAEMGFTHVEFLPVAEHPFGGSWGYQVSAYYAPYSPLRQPGRFPGPGGRVAPPGHRGNRRLGAGPLPPRRFRAGAASTGPAFTNMPARMGSHPDWGTLVFNLGRHEVRNFLIANALFWVDQYHIDALRVDAVASMLYLDYSRQAGEWVPNEFGGNENLEAVSFLKELNETIYSLYPGATTIAEESTSWPASPGPPTWAASVSATSGTWAGCTTRSSTSRSTRSSAATTKTT